MFHPDFIALGSRIAKSNDRRGEISRNVYVGIRAIVEERRNTGNLSRRHRASQCGANVHVERRLTDAADINVRVANRMDVAKV